MMSRTLGRLLIALLPVTWMLGAATTAVADLIRYDAVELGSLPGYRSSQAHGLNDRGQVVGESFNRWGLSAPFLYGDGKLTSLAPMSSVADINNSGRITTSSEGNINNLGQTVHTSRTAGHFAIRSGDAEVNVAGPASSTFTIPSYINDSTQVAGVAEINGVFHPFLYSGGRFTDLGLHGAQSGSATGLNNLGQVVISLGGFTYSNRGLLYSDGNFTDLGSLGGTFTSPSDLNDAGQVVGASSLVAGSNDFRAFLYDSGMMRDLNDLVAIGGGLTLYNGPRKS